MSVPCTSVKRRCDTGGLKRVTINDGHVACGRAVVVATAVGEGQWLCNSSTRR